MAEEKSYSLKSGATVLRDHYYSELLRKNLMRLALTYLAPLILLSLYFYLQYTSIFQESHRQHLKSTAEFQSNTLDLFLSERVVNLSNLIDDPKLELPPSLDKMQALLDQLQKASDTFIDIGFFDSTGIQRSYAGPLPYLKDRNYSQEQWYVDLKRNEDNYIITDIYLGFRQKPHFTIGVRRIINDQYVALRATLDPERFYAYVNSLLESNDVSISIVNREGTYQLVTPHAGTPLHASTIIPPKEPRIDIEKVEVENHKITYAYAWLRNANWAVIVQWTQPFSDLPSRWGIIAISFAVNLLVLTIIVFRSKRLVEIQLEKEIAKAQLEHAAKLASVGELSAGVAHEINNPLAIIAEETGLIKDLMNPEYNANVTFDDLIPHLNNIHDAVFRCRDITRKLLSFVRKADIKVMPHSINKILDEVVDTFWVREMEVSNIEVARNYQNDIPDIATDANQIKQVFLNLLNNAVDAITPPGKIAITTRYEDYNITVAISDTGKGITHEQMERIFMPFYTTKEVGKGTGLGLSVSLSIIKSMGGNILAESIPGKGSVFSVVLPTK